MAEPARNHEQPHERTSKLHELGLSHELIEGAVLRGFVARQSCTPLDPPSYPGIVQWGRTHRGMRELAVPQEWTADDSRNYSCIVSPDRSTAVTVATGNENTGVHGASEEPRTKYRRGPQTAARVDTNVHIDQLALWPQEGKPEQTDGQALWILLIATTKDEIRYELSRPNGQDQDGRVVSWSDRIVFDPIEIESIPTRSPEDDDDDDGDAGFDVPVERI